MQLAVEGYDRNFSYLIGDAERRVAYLVDPDNYDLILSVIAAERLSIEAIVLTHGHDDHTQLALPLNREQNLPVYIHFADKHRLPEGISPLYDLATCFHLQIGGVQVQVIHTPGHTPGGVCLRLGHHLITGDTVFVGRCGKTIFPGGSSEQMRVSIKALLSLPDETIIYPGHDYGPTPTSTIGREKRENIDFIDVLKST